MNYRRIAAAASTAWVVSIPFGAFIQHGMLGHVYAAQSGFNPAWPPQHRGERELLPL